MKTNTRNVIRILLGSAIVASSFYLTPIDRSGAAHTTGALGTTLTVTNNLDSGPGSLRQAITDSNAVAGADTITFNIPGGGTHTIMALSLLPTITDPVTIDGTTQPGYADTPLIILSGQGLQITSGSSTVKAIAVIRSNASAGITLETGGNNTVTGCYVGIDPANETDTTTGNAFGVAIVNSADNQIGGSFATPLRNVIAYNTGVRIVGAGATGNVVAGNIIGLRSNGSDGATGLGNYGVYIEGASNNRVGGTTAAERNILSGYNRTSNSSAGIWLLNASGNHVQGNYIGTDITGTLARPNRDGIRIDESPNNMIGAAAGTTFAGPCTGGCNLISGNARDGVRLNGEGTAGNRLDYNYIGLTASGLAALRNTTFAIHFTNTGPNTIGKPRTPAGARAPKIEADQATGSEITIEDENFCITIDRVANSHTVTPKRGGEPIPGYGEGFIDENGNFFYVSDPGSDPAVRFEDFKNSALAYASIEFLALPRYRFSAFRSTACSTPINGQQYVNGQSADDTSPGSTGTTYIGVNFGGSVNGIDNLAVQNEIPLPFTFGSNLFLDQNSISSRTLQSITVQNGVGVENAYNRFTLRTQGAFNFRTDPIPFDLTTPAANHGLPPPVDLRVERSPLGLNISGLIQGWPPNTPLIINLYGQNHYRNGDGTESIQTIPLNVTSSGTTDEEGEYFIFIPGSFVEALTELISAQATVVPPSASSADPQGSVPGDTSEFSLPAKIPKGIYDFDGDGMTDVAVIRPGAGNTVSYWYILNSTNGTFRIQQFGLGDDRPVPGDYQGDDRADFAVWRPSTGTLFFSRINGDPTTNFVGIRWGLPGDIPVVGDFDDDGANDAAIFRPSSGIWYIHGSLGGRLIAQQWGLATDKPVPADYDGDGDTDIAVYRDGVWWISVCPQCPPLIRTFGLSTDIPVPGDYDGDGIDDIAIWRPSDGVWWILQSRTGSPTAVQWGIAGDRPLKGDWDGDGRNDIAVWRPSTGDWWILRSKDTSFFSVHWGQQGDIPIGAFPE